MCVDADVELPRGRLKPSVGVAVQVYRTLSHLIPSPESVVAQDEMIAVLAEFRVMLDTRPTFGTRCRLGIIVADNQMLPAVELGQ